MGLFSIVCHHCHPLHLWIWGENKKKMEGYRKRQIKLRTIFKKCGKPKQSKLTKTYKYMMAMQIKEPNNMGTITQMIISCHYMKLSKLGLCSIELYCWLKGSHWNSKQKGQFPGL